MRKVFLLFVFCFSLFFSFAQNYKVLFIGNSYTEVNNLPQLISKACTSVGDTISYSSSTSGGCTFQQHLSISSSLIQQGGWDYVVLQEQSQLPSFPDGQFYQECYPYAQQLCEMIRQYNPDAKIVFYMTWGRKNGDQNNCQFFSPLCTYEGMDSLLNLRYMIMAVDNHTLVSPVGYVWHNIRDNHPEIELYQSDESHPSLAGSYAAACTFYSILFEKNPDNITFNPGIDDQMANIIRNTTKNLVYDSLSKWSFLPNATDDTLSVGQIDQAQVKLYPNPVYDNLTLELTNFNVETFDVCIYNTIGILVKEYTGKTNIKETIDVSDLDNGIYLVRVKSNNNTVYNTKFIKVR